MTEAQNFSHGGHHDEHVMKCAMTKLLEDAIAKARALPDDEQDEAGEMLLLLMMAKHDEPVPLDDETRAAIREGLEQARRGEFASDEEMAAFFKRHGL